MKQQDQNTYTILNSLAEGVITVDKEFKITFINQAAAKITGFTQNEVIGKICKNVFRSEFCMDNCPILNVLKTNKSVFDLETEIECKNDFPRPVRINAAVLMDDNQSPVGAVITLRDISLLKKYEILLNQDNSFHGILSKSKQMREIFTLIEQISETDAPVLITGETGTGKELIADAIQKLSKRKNEKYIKVNISVIPQTLLASELFGHVKGAFTDAYKERLGRFELAHKGTIFLDEIGEMPYSLQPQILRVLQDGSFERLGESVTRYCDVRIIAATNIDIEKALSEGKFREDLFYRLNVIHLDIPPLNKRKEDIPLLINHFLNKFSITYKKNIPGIEEDFLELMLNYRWPGNVRELENAMEYAVIKNKSDKNLCVCSLPKKIRGAINCKKKNSLEGLEALNNISIIELLNKHKWNKSEVAKELGIDRTTLWRKLKSLGIN